MTETLPPPSPDALSVSALLSSRIALRILAQGGWIPFSEFMQCALYEPRLGYYTGGSFKLGVAGDFTTAPELSDLFGRALAQQVHQVMRRSQPVITEFGAGTGRLALSLLRQLASLDALPESYRILDVSGELRARQGALFANAPSDISDRIEWLERLPERIFGAIIANEVLDAVPTEIVTRAGGRWLVRGVCCDPEGRFAFEDRAPDPAFQETLVARFAGIDGLEEGYTTELNRAAEALVLTLAERIELGAAFFLDYGFPAHEYYHAQRTAGTVMAHYRHRAHGDLLRWPGLQDLTAHVDFSAIAASAKRAGAKVLGYTNQARFLINCGITDLIDASPEDAAAWLVQTNALQRLLSEAEMGELFKVLAIGKGVSEPLLGFIEGDRSGTL